MTAELPQIPGFRVVEELGSGPISSVYKAIEEPLGRTVALKVLKPTIAPTSLLAAQLEREAGVLSELCHPNIRRLHAFVKTDARMHLVLELVDGFGLATLVKGRRAVPADCVAAIGVAVARGLAHAHERGIVHRDIKPANVMVSRHGEVKIFDFGIAQRSSPKFGARWPSNAERLAGLGPVRIEDVAAFGTPAYMSPEQILGEEVDARSDVFSLGVVLYELACGLRPFERDDEGARGASVHPIRRDPPVPLHHRAPDVPAAIERVIMCAVEKLPSDRFPSAAQMTEALEQAAPGRTGPRAAKPLLAALDRADLGTPTGAHIPGVQTPRPRPSSGSVTSTGGSLEPRGSTCDPSRSRRS